MSAGGAYHGGCHCGTIAIALHSARPVATLVPRACDCSFCRKHGAAWVSDPDGALQVTLRDPAALARYRQGSASAEFLICARCGVLVAAELSEGGRRWAAVNGAALERAAELAAAVPVSPQQLDAAAKRQRWQALWIARVEYVSAPP